MKAQLKAGTGKKPGGQMLFGQYTFASRFETDAVLPPYKGSTFRGVFGTALKRVTCALKRQECGQCILRQRCLYALVFETPLAVEPPAGLPVSAVPHPFVLEPPADSRSVFGKGDTIDCRLSLFGEVNKSLPYFVYAFDQMGAIGIGKKVNGRRATFTLEEVFAGDRLVYTKQSGNLKLPDVWAEIRLPEVKESSDDTVRLKLTLETPLRLKFENRLQAELPFHVLVRAALRRISSLYACYGAGEPELDYRGLVDEAQTVCVKKNDLRWVDWKRYSNRQERSMLMGGITGSVIYEGKLGRFLPLLELCARVHLGKQTAFGLGKIGLTLAIPTEQTLCAPAERI